MNIDYFIKSAAPFDLGSDGHKALVDMLNSGQIDQKTFDLSFKNGIVPTIAPSIIKNRSMVASSPDHRELVNMLNSGQIDQNTFDLSFKNGIVPTIVRMPKQKPVALTDLESLAAMQSITGSGQDPNFGGLMPKIEIPAFTGIQPSPLDVHIPEKAVADGTNFIDLKNLDTSSSSTLSGQDPNFGGSIPTIEINKFPGDTQASPFDIRIPEKAVADGTGTISLNQFISPNSTPNPTATPSSTLSIPELAVSDSAQSDIFNTLTGVSVGNNDANKLGLPEGHRASGQYTLSDDAIQDIKKQVAADKAKVPGQAVQDGTENPTSHIQRFKAQADAAQRAKEQAEAAAQQAAAATPAQTPDNSDTFQKYLLWGGLGTAGALGLAGYLMRRNNNKKKKQRRPYAMPPVYQQPMMQGQYPYQGGMQGHYPKY